MSDPMLLRITTDASLSLRCPRGGGTPAPGPATGKIGRLGERTEGMPADRIA
jgi:hypothetical protein